MKKILYSALALTLAASMVSCHDYLDINASPNSPSEENLDASMIMPGAELAFVGQYGNRLRTFGGYYSQLYSQLPGTSNFLSMAGFTMTSGLNNSIYTQLCMRALNNLNIVRNISEANEDWGSYLAATVIRVASYQVMADAYGAIPYYEGMNIDIPAPKYDDASVVYPELVKELDQALEKVGPSDDVCTNFLFQNQKAANWIKTAKALKLRLLMRMCGVADVKAQLAALVADNDFPTADVEWAGFWQNSAANANPWFYEEFWPGMQNNVTMNTALQVAYEYAQDSREGVYWNTNADGDFFSWVSSSVGITTASQYMDAALFSRPNMAYDSPVSFISVAEIEFFLAEYEKRFGSASAAKDHFEAAVKASFASAGLSDADAQLVLDAFPWSDANYLKSIGIQKWLHLSGVNPFECYCELRRLKYPAFGSAQGTDIYSFNADNYNPDALTAGELYTPIQVDPNVGANKLLQRWPFPSSSMSTNSNVPEFAGYTTPIFWAK